MNERELQNQMRSDQTDAYVEQEFAKLAVNTGLANLIVNIALRAKMDSADLYKTFEKIFAGGVAYGMLRGAKETGAAIIRTIDEGLKK